MKRKYQFVKQSVPSTEVYVINVIEDGKCVQSVPTEFTTESQAEEFVSLCNQHDVDPVHIYDLIDDMLCDAC